MVEESKPFIVRFYGPERAADSQGRSLDDILQFNDRALEFNHDYIQILFPLPERSPVNRDAPLITKAVRDAFHTDEALRDALYTAFKHMANFYAFDLVGPKDMPRLSPKQNLPQLAMNTWLTGTDHNHLRITRIIRCLRILGLESVAKAFYDVLREHNMGRVSQRSLMYWQRAAERPLHLPPDEADENAKGVEWLRE